MTYDILFSVFYEIPIGVLLRFCDVFDANEYHCGLEKCWERNHGSEIYSSNHDKANVKCQALRYLKALAYCVFILFPADLVMILYNREELLVEVSFQFPIFK